MQIPVGFDLSLYGKTNLVTANFVATAQGEYINEKGSSRGIGDSLDLELLKLLRANHSAVLVGGNTARQELYKPSPRFETYVLTTRPTSIARGLNALAAESDSQLSRLVEQLRVQHDGLLIEAGPALVAKLLEQRVIDRLHLNLVGSGIEPEETLRKLFGTSTGTCVSCQVVENTSYTVWSFHTQQ